MWAGTARGWGPSPLPFYAISSQRCAFIFLRLVSDAVEVPLRRPSADHEKLRLRAQRAYAGLARLFDQYRLSHIFAPGFPGLHEAFYVQERLVELLMPAVHAAFVSRTAGI